MLARVQRNKQISLSIHISRGKFGNIYLTSLIFIKNVLFATETQLQELGWRHKDIHLRIFNIKKLEHLSFWTVFQL